ncbi:50S ribosomal protein L14 [Mycolicibacterium fortuitum]|uniref:50S ribosomal protein L14 n=1 Tax=Mycolicibacterium fortuitum TaxID=1766 RepID=A0A378WDW6_MYCFO|nr:50S ribosomal protein L14 [Mycolicibacterium fortuitum]
MVRTVKERRRADGSYIKFDENAPSSSRPTTTARGTRIFGPVAGNCARSASMKIVSLAPEVL